MDGTRLGRADPTHSHYPLPRLDGTAAVCALGHATGRHVRARRLHHGGHEHPATSIPRHADLESRLLATLKVDTDQRRLDTRTAGRSVRFRTINPGCGTQLIDAEGVRWFSIRSFSQNGMLGEQFRQQTIALERRAMALKPVRPGSEQEQ